MDQPLNDIIRDIGGTMLITTQIKGDPMGAHWIRPAIRCTKCSQCFELTTDGFKCPHCDGVDPRDARIARLQAEVRAWRSATDVIVFYNNDKLASASKAVNDHKDLEPPCQQ